MSRSIIVHLMNPEAESALLVEKDETLCEIRGGVLLEKDGALCEISKVQNKKRFQSLSWPMVMEGRKKKKKE